MNGCYFKTNTISDNEGCQGTLNQGILTEGEGLVQLTS